MRKRKESLKDESRGLVCDTTWRSVRQLKETQLHNIAARQSSVVADTFTSSRARIRERKKKQKTYGRALGGHNLKIITSLGG
jgi:hypothetical protein